MRSLYDLESVKPYWVELKNIGVKPLTTRAEVDEVFEDKSGTMLLVINSVCGCAAGHARPGVGLALQNDVIPDRLYTVFAGVDRDATYRAREHMPGYEPSSPSAALFKDGELVFMLERRTIEASDSEAIAEILKKQFDRYCHSPGPSVRPEVFIDNFRPPRCSSTLPSYKE